MSAGQSASSDEATGIAHIVALFVALAAFILIAGTGFETYYDDGPVIDHGYVQCGAPIAEIFRGDSLAPHPCGPAGMGRVLGALLAAAVGGTLSLLIAGAFFGADIEWLKEWLTDKGITR